MKKQKGNIQNIVIIIVGIISLLIFVAWFMFGYPVWRVWSAEKAGEAELAKAEMTKKIMVQTAQAELDSAHLRAEAIGILGEIAQKYPEYRQQEFIQAFGEALREGNIAQIVYVPTEANIPITEAGKR